MRDVTRNESFPRTKHTSIPRQKKYSLQTSKWPAPSGYRANMCDVTLRDAKPSVRGKNPEVLEATLRHGKKIGHPNASTSPPTRTAILNLQQSAVTCRQDRTLPH
ncbi:hypothetical protein J6590_023541 [Homalodisca vitripennis]|nr:hypothetical protein J6590_023541 [Homalodisca vitripennis]